ncbi:MAG: hypothetical protein V4543_03030 [Bacteroidota bacterium]
MSYSAAGHLAEELYKTLIMKPDSFRKMIYKQIFMARNENSIKKLHDKRSDLFISGKMLYFWPDDIKQLRAFILCLC